MGFAQDAKSQIVQSSKDSIFAVIKKATSHHTNQNFVTNNYQKQMLQRWFSYHTDIQVSRVSPKDRKHTAPFIHEANKLYIVDDITIGQIPMLIQHMTSMTYGSQAPNEAVSHSIQKNLYTYIQILKSYKTESDADSLVGQYTSLYMQLYPTANDPLLGEDSTLIDDNLYTQYVANHLDDIDMPRVVDSLLTNDIVGGLYTSVFEHGAQKIRTVSNLDQTIHIKSYQDQLTKTTATGNKLTLAAQQKKIIKEIMLLINQSDLSKQSYGRSFLDESVPTKIMQTKKIACV
ncbi:hypothetical protein KA037_04340 [Patescibacteria group bacterium]|nr:hypothetical protein [Patescibacteria group bacterium]